MELDALVLIVAAATFSSCSTTPPSSPHPQTQEAPAETPRNRAASSPEQRQMLESILRLVLDAHNFLPPVFVDGPDASRWALSTRPASQGDAVLALIKVGAENEISVELVVYAHVGSTWALLGREFRGLADQEARQMDQQIRERLAH